MAVYSSIATLGGAREVNSQMGLAAYQDLGGKVERLISAMNLVNAHLSTIQVALVSAAASNVSFSSISAGTFVSTFGSVVNFYSS